jgi:GDPmannose 4,6-dehydratase
MKQAVITGISGQDGAYHGKFLLDQGYNICGTSCDIRISPFINPPKPGIRDHEAARGKLEFHHKE